MRSKILLIGMGLIKCLMILIALQLTACDEGSEKKYSDVKIRNLFIENKDDFYDMARFCEKNYFIERLDKTEANFYSEVELTQEIKKEILLMRKKMQKTLVLALSCGRRGDYQGSPLSAVDMLIYAEGLSIAGSAQKILYVTDWQIKINAENKIKNEFGVLLESPNWFYYSWDD